MFIFLMHWEGTSLCLKGEGSYLRGKQGRGVFSMVVFFGFGTSEVLVTGDSLGV